MNRAALFVLADGQPPEGARTPAEPEPAWPRAASQDADSLEDFCRGRLHTAGLVAAALAAAAAAGMIRWSWTRPPTPAPRYWPCGPPPQTGTADDAGRPRDLADRPT